MQVISKYNSLLMLRLSFLEELLGEVEATGPSYCLVVERCILKVQRRSDSAEEDKDEAYALEEGDAALPVCTSVFEGWSLIFRSGTSGAFWEFLSLLNDAVPLCTDDEDCTVVELPVTRIIFDEVFVQLEAKVLWLHSFVSICILSFPFLFFRFLEYSLLLVSISSS